MLPSTLLGLGLGLGRVKPLPLWVRTVVPMSLVPPLPSPGLPLEDLVQLGKTKCGIGGGVGFELTFPALDFLVTKVSRSPGVGI